MSRTKKFARVALVTLVSAEAIAATNRFSSREDLFALAERRAKETGRTLVVIGDPNGGAHTRLLSAYGCGDACVDLTGCPSCPGGIAADITRDRVERVADDSAVVYVSCVLEYVSDPQAAWREILRMAGSPENVFLVTVQPWTATAALYPGAKNTVAKNGRALATSNVSTARKVVTAGVIAALAWLSFRKE